MVHKINDEFYSGESCEGECDDINGGPFCNMKAETLEIKHLKLPKGEFIAEDAISRTDFYEQCAVQAMHAFITAFKGSGCFVDGEVLAEQSFNIAYAMECERKKRAMMRPAPPPTPRPSI